jgi:hypothetical protein
MKLIKNQDVVTIELTTSSELDSGILSLVMNSLGGVENPSDGVRGVENLSDRVPVDSNGAVLAVLEHQWDGTKLRIKNPDGSWGEWVNLRGEMGEMGFDGRDGSDGWDGQDGVDGDIPEHEWNGTQIRFKQPNGQWGEFVEFGDVIMRSQQFFGTSGDTSGELSPQHKLYRQTKVSKWEPVKMSNQYSEGTLFFRTIGEKILNIRGTAKTAVPLWAGAEIGTISRRDAGIIHYGIEPEPLAEVHQLVASDRFGYKRIVIDSKHKIRCLQAVQEGETLYLDLVVCR